MDPSQINPDDVMKLLSQVIDAAGQKNWLVFVPLLVIAIIAAFRKWAVPAWSKLSWFASDRGGALLALIGAVATSVIAAAATTGPHTVSQILAAAVTFLLGNQLLFTWLKKLISPSGADLANQVATKAAAVGAQVATDASASAQAAADALNKVGK